MILGWIITAMSKRARAEEEAEEARLQEFLEGYNLEQQERKRIAIEKACDDAWEKKQ